MSTGCTGRVPSASRMSHRRVLQAARGAAALVALSARLARAEEPPSEPAAAPPTDKVRLAYRAPPDCPDEVEFSAAVRERLPAGWEAASGELATVFEIDVVPRNERFSATIRFRDARGEPFQRAVEGASCADVVNGIALVTALAIRSRVGGVEEQTVAPPAPAPSPPSPVKPVERAAPPAPAPALAPRRTFFRTGALGLLTTGVGPELAFGGGAFFGAELGSAWLGLTLGGVTSGRVHASSVPSEFRLLLARVDGCPVALRLGAKLAVEPCALLEAGSLRAETFESQPRVTRPGSGSAAWLAPGALLRFVVRFDPVILGLEGFGRFPLFHEEFYVDANGTRDAVYTVPSVTWGGAFAVGLRF